MYLSVDWFLYDRDLRHEGIKGKMPLVISINTE